MGTRKNRLAEAVLTSTHNLCFEEKYENIRIFYHKSFIFLVLNPPDIFYHTWKDKWKDLLERERERQTERDRERESSGIVAD